ncbi:MAG: hypothetical protein IJD13_00260 [Oscillospiraceae bacterium]|nr:hypothetical protein [Oscillospiraceae bacterium]
MYGKRNAYFGSAKAGFQNSVWVELIGFDCTLPDMGVSDYVENLGFLPDKISLHLTSIDFVNSHRGMEKEALLPVYACSYGGHPRNDDRERQNWTNFGLKKLVEELHRKNIKVYGSFFDMDSDNGLEGVPLFSELHPELMPAGNGRMERGIIMIKRFADGSYYEDYLLKKLCETAADYGFDGFQIADGISSLRSNLWYSDFSDDLLEQAGITLPDGVEDRSIWLWQNKRTEWISFYRRRWGSFLKKIIGGLKEAGLSAIVNSAWTRDPLEALFRYGVDYRVIAEAGADALIPEDVSSDLAILSTGDNHGFKMSYDHRKLIHYEFLANLMTLRAYLPDVLPLTPLFMIWDNQEQWDVLHHAPTAMQRAAAGNFCHFVKGGDGLVTITNGPHFCLGDALKKGEWADIRLCLDNAYIDAPADVEGAAFLWSNARMERELNELLVNGKCHSARWLALLMRAGAMVHKVVRIEDLDSYSGDLVVTNPSLLPENELEVVKRYDRGRAFLFEKESGLTFDRPNPPCDGWPYPLVTCDPDGEMLADAAEKINEGCNARIADGDGKEECTLCEVRTGEHTSRIIIDNNEYYYVLPRVTTGRRIRSVKVLTKPEGYDAHCTADGFRVRIPGRGVDIIDVSYED